METVTEPSTPALAGTPVAGAPSPAGAPGPERPEALSEYLLQVARSLPPGTVSVRELFERIGPQGLLMVCMFLNLPFLVPVSIPGVSTAFGLLVILIGLGLASNRLPWLPERLMKRAVPSEKLAHAFEHGARLVARIERWLHPRLQRLTRGRTMTRINGLSIVAGGGLLMFPFGFVPFSNTLPAGACLAVALGMLEEDGGAVLTGYVLLLATVVYFGVLFYGAWAAGSGLGSLIG
jgi:hypothetical protein